MAKRYRTNKFKKFLRAAICCAFVCVTVLGLTSCKPTDFFTEVIISPFAETVDVNNPNQLVVNSPDAEQESTELASLDWTDDATKSEEVQTLITYSENPTSELAAHHSIFSLTPRFHGIVSSDAVQLDFTDDTDLEEEGNPNPTDTDNSAQQSLLEGLQALMEGAQTTDGPSDNGAQKSDNTADGEGEGEGGDPYAGYDGDVDVYDPNNGRSKINHVDHVAATGQAAVLVEALGGTGALCAMDVDTYNGDGTTISYFGQVFGDELADGFVGNCLLWRNDGTSSDDVVDIDAIIDACGEGGVIVFDQSEGSVNQRFNEEQRKHLQAASIQLIPVDFSTVQGIIDAAYAIGEALSESDETALRASDMANEYVSRIYHLVNTAVSSHGGSLAAKDDTQSGSRLLTTWNGFAYTTQSQHVYTAIGTDYITGIKYVGYGTYTSLSTENGLLFARLNESTTPLSFWAQAAGVWNTAAEAQYAPSNSYAIIWGINSGAVPGDDGEYLSSKPSNALEWIKLASPDVERSSLGYFGNGLGSSAFPYLIVSSSGSKSAAQVKESIVYQMESKNPLNPYSILPWQENMGNSAPGSVDSNGNWNFSTIGSTTYGSSTGSVFINQGVDPWETVRENPTGLLGSWTDGSVECMLECIWIARIYSEPLEHSSYSPICDLSTDTLRSEVEDFYNTFYFHDTSSAQDWYELVVTDDGL